MTDHEPGEGIPLAEVPVHFAAGEVRTRVTAGQAVLNPKGVWHTADVEEPFDAIYLTPCPGTDHRSR